MKTRTKISTAVFIVAVIVLYSVIYVVPKMQGMLEETEVLEYGDMPLKDSVNVLIVRNETLFAADKSGAVEYLIDEGTKVRAGVPLVSITDAQAPEGGGAADEDAVEAETEAGAEAGIMAAAAANAIQNPGNVAPFTALLSYSADGYETILTPGAIEGLHWDASTDIPESGLSLVRGYTEAGAPLYKLTDNNLWFMVYWVKSEREGPVKYTSASAVNVDGSEVTTTGIQVRIGKTVVDASIDSVTPQGEYDRIVLRSDMYYKALPVIRKIDAEVIFSEHQGLIVNDRNIEVRDGKPGVLVRQRNDRFEWVPINILKTAGDKHIVSAGRFQDEKGESVYTVKYYDEVLKDPAAEGKA
jgi:hypothetical protein